MERISLFGQSLDELCQRMAELGQKPFRGKQLYHQLYHRHCFNLDAMTDMAVSLRKQLQEKFRLDLPEIERVDTAADGTAKYLLRLTDGYRIEAVFIPEETRTTLCLSTQAGCAMGCRFCATARLGFQRDLSAGEILAQYYLIAANQGLAGQPVNIVFMGMGEPLLNLGAVMGAFRILVDPAGAALSRRKITLSTCGLADEIRQFGQEADRPKLAVSLNAATDPVRNLLMPVNQRYPLAELLQCCRDFPLAGGERITFEYVLVHGINDSVAEARQLTRLLRGIRCKVNLIPYNECPDLPFLEPDPATVSRFQEILGAAHFTAIIRKSRGREIRAACGQLAAEYPRTEGKD